MKKTTINVFFLLLFLSPFASSQCVITYASAGPGYTNVGSYCSPANLSAFQGAQIPSSYSPTISPAAHIAKTCAEAKGKIQREYGECMNSAAVDNLTQTARCTAMKDSSWSWGVNVGFPIFFGGVVYAIEDPNYQKCRDMVVAVFDNTKSVCELSKKTSENIERSANNARCANFY